MIQAALLGLALVLLRPRVDAVLLKDGQNKHPICLMRIIRYLANLKQKQKIFKFSNEGYWMVEGEPELIIG